MTQALVLQKVADKETVAHESIHVTAFIYYLIKYYPHFNNYELLDEIFDWTLDNVTIVETDDYKGQFCHRNWKNFTRQAHVYCCFAGMLGGYIYSFIDKPNFSKEKNLDLLTWIFDNDMDPEKLRLYYDMYGASKDLEQTGIVDYNERLDYIKEILSLLKGSTVFNDLLNDCMKQLENKRILYKEELVSLAHKYMGRILCETFTKKRTCVSITEKGPKYSYYV